MIKTSCKVKSTTNNNDTIEGYWTKERREQAIPKPFPELPFDFEESDTVLSKTTSVILENTSIDDTERYQEIEAPLAIPIETPQNYPNRCNGKLFFTWKGDDYVGSAGSIMLEVLLTAAHNVYDGGEWSDNFMYYPGYPQYAGLKTSWSWSKVAIFDEWKISENFAYDYAMIYTETPMNSIGSLPSILNLPPQNRTWTAYGYPAEEPYNGEQMYKTTGNYVSGSRIITMDNNDMTRGSSGGNWITTIGTKDYVNGIQSTRGSQPDYANSPYLDKDEYNALLDCLENPICE